MYNVGNILVFTGNRTGEDHFNNFKVGKKYVIKNISNVTYDMDSILGYNETCVFFENCEYGTYIDKLEPNFMKLSEYRNKQLNDILNIFKK